MVSAASKPSLYPCYNLTTGDADGRRAPSTQDACGDQTLFARQDVVEEAWRIVDPILGNAVPVHRYKQGTWGPDAANEILLPEGGWHAPQVDGKG